MATRNISLTAEQDAFIEKVAALRAQVKEGVDALASRRRR